MNGKIGRKLKSLLTSGSGAIERQDPSTLAALSQALRQPPLSPQTLATRKSRTPILSGILQGISSALAVKASQKQAEMQMSAQKELARKELEAGRIKRLPIPERYAEAFPGLAGKTYEEAAELLPFEKEITARSLKEKQEEMAKRRMGLTEKGMGLRERAQGRMERLEKWMEVGGNKKRDAVVALNQAEIGLDLFNEARKELAMTGKTGPVTGRFASNASAISGGVKFPEVKTYDDLVNTFVTMFKAPVGQENRMSDEDRKAMAGMIPKVGESDESANRKFEFMRKLIDRNRQPKIKAIKSILGNELGALAIEEPSTFNEMTKNRLTGSAVQQKGLSYIEEK